jgi:methylase of polypeptide subunit release factors
MTPSTKPEDALLELGRALQASDYHFTTVTPATHERVNARAGNAWAKTLKDVLGWSRPFRAEILPPAVFELMTQAQVLAPHEDGWRALVRVSSLGEQLFFHSAFPTVESDAVFFGPDTYRFAGAIERLFLTQRMQIRRAVDVCCGAGPGAVSVAKFCPHATIFGTDINPRELKRVTAICCAMSRANSI